MMNSMPKPAKNRIHSSGQTTTVGWEAQLWQMADALRGSMDAAEYKHVCLGLVFLSTSPTQSKKSRPRSWPEKAQGADLDRGMFKCEG
jgi:type I restriction enzyme M protein